MENTVEEKKQKRLRHYCVLREDLPLGQKFAQLGHAAGESAFHYARDLAGVQFPEREPPFVGEADFIALEASLAEMLEAIAALEKREIRVTKIVETDPGPWQGQLLSFGVEPIIDNRVNKILYHFRHEIGGPKPVEVVKFERPESD